jgi:outer membrane protein TolC
MRSIGHRFIWSQFHMRTIAIPACLVAALVFGAGTVASVSAQQPTDRTPHNKLPPRARRAGPAHFRRDAVRLALENNLGIQVARINPQIEDLSVAQARAAWAPNFGSTFNRTGPTPRTAAS